MTTLLSRRARCQLVAASLLVPTIAVAQTPAWMRPRLSPDRRTTLLLGAMTLEEKFQQLVGAPGAIPEIPACYGARHVPGIARLRIPTFRITNGPVGVGQNDCVPAGTPNLPRAAMMSTASAKATALPSAMAVAASFDPGVAARFGDVIGVESRNHALHVLEGPGVNLARVPQGGRNFEYFGEDPFLTGTMAVAEIHAIQKHGVIAMAKHFIANDHETNRGTANEIIADRVLHELYLLPFEMAVKSGNVASVMCSYNSVNGPHACEDPHHLTDVLRTQWGFKGYVQSDFFAMHSTVPALLAGMDHEMPGLALGPFTPWYTPARLQAALDRKEIDVANIDTALARRYRQMFRLGIFDRPVATTPIDVVRDAAIARSIGEQAAVLLKNERGLLPLDAKSIRSVALIGQAEYATKAVAGCCGGSSDVIPFTTVTPLDGMRQVLALSRSSATTTLTVVADDRANLTDAIAAARAADVAIVLAGTIAEEGRDRQSIALANGQDSLITAIVAANPRTIVVLKDNASSLTPWIDAVPAVLEAWFPGQEDGAIVARLLFGLATPSGKLPVTFPMREADLPANTARRWPGVDTTGAPVSVISAGGFGSGMPTTVEYSEGLQMGYRWFDANAIAPRFPFGFGLSYTSFTLSNLVVSPRATDGTQPIIVSVRVTNTGRRRGAEVPQVYIALPPAAGEPPKRLVAFTKVWLEPGQARTVRVVIDPRAPNHPLGIWDSAAQHWSVPSGRYAILVGSSSASITLTDSISVRTPRR
ncbi:MAG: glycoside hydrolase family 3 C-terminal domain-containing protein [bacterium]